MARPSTKDMDRWSLELRLYLTKEFNRFRLASKLSLFEEVLLDSLPRDPNEALQDSQENTIKLDRLSSREDERRLSTFLERLVNKCSSLEDHELMQRTLRSSLLTSRRRSIMAVNNSDNNSGSSDSSALREPLCFFCSVDLPRQPEGALNNGDCAHKQPPVDMGQPLATDQLLYSAGNVPAHPLSINFYQETPPSSVSAPTPDLNAAPSTTPPLGTSSVPVNRPSEAARMVYIAPVQIGGQQPTVNQEKAAFEQANNRQRRTRKTNASNAKANSQPAPRSTLARFKSSELRISTQKDDEESSSSSSSSSLPRQSHLASAFVASLQVDGESTMIDEPEELGGHEDSMQNWFQDLNDKNPVDLPRASTPLATISGEEKLDNKKRGATTLDLQAARPELKMTIKKRNNNLNCTIGEPQPAQLQLSARAILSANAPRSTTPPLLSEHFQMLNGASLTSFSQQPQTADSRAPLNVSLAGSACQFSSQQLGTSRAPVAKIKTKRTKRRQNTCSGHNNSKQFFKQSDA